MSGLMSRLFLGIGGCAEDKDPTQRSATPQSTSSSPAPTGTTDPSTYNTADNPNSHYYRAPSAAGASQHSEYKYTNAAFSAQSPSSPGESAIPTPNSPSPQPATPTDIFSSRSKTSATTASKPIAIATLSRNSPLPDGSGSHPILIDDESFPDCGMVNMTTGPFIESTSSRTRQDSFVSAGPKPISMNNPNRDHANRQRRESLAGSLMGRSWGGMSVGSFVRDDVLMAGTSPYGHHQSPSFQSSSYLPKLEANFMRDFTCCNRTLPTLHDLLQHYEEAHAQEPAHPAAQTPTILQYAQMAGLPGGGNQFSNFGGVSHSGMSGSGSHQGRQQMNLGGMMGLGGSQASHGLPILNDELDAVGEMEMDDAVGPMEMDDSQRMQQTRQLFGQAGRPQLHVNSAGLTQGLRTSQPTTPAGASFGFQHNPTVSSVNTPTLTTQQPMSSRGQSSYNMQTPVASRQNEMDSDLSGMSMGENMDDEFAIDLGPIENTECINDPAKALFRPNGAAGNAQQAIALQQRLSALGLDQSQALANNRELLQRFAPMLLQQDEPKPFKCPVVGCEKAYKNQNGLKYHKAHGHSNQQLHENEDGTFSIVNPDTCAPYPGTLGMEKEKPYSCEVCHKRYKNLNGLKYHKNHSPYCNPELSSQLLAAQMQLPDVSQLQPPTGQH